jgi:hypothetical protein
VRFWPRKGVRGNFVPRKYSRREGTFKIRRAGSAETVYSPYLTYPINFLFGLLDCRVAFCSLTSLRSSLSVSLLHSISPSFITAYEPTSSLCPARLMCCMTRTPRPLSRLRLSGMAALFSSRPHSLNLARLFRSTNLQYVRERVQWLKLRLHALDPRFRSCLRAISSLRSQITPNPLDQLSKTARCHS